MTLLPAMPVLAAKPQKTSIVRIYADEIGFGDLQCYGGSRVLTSNVDCLAGVPARFREPQVNSNSTRFMRHDNGWMTAIWSTNDNK